MNAHRPKRRFVDLSIYLENDVLSDPPPLAPKITYQKHADTLPEFMAMIPGTTAEDYPDGEADTIDDWRSRAMVPGCRVTASGVTTRTAAAEAACPTQIVDTSGRMDMIVS